MSSLDAFNEMYSDFVNDLSLAFPDNEHVLKFKSEFEALKTVGSQAPLDAFMKVASAKTQALTTRDPSFVNEFSFGPVWAEASTRTKDAIWQHLNGMYMIAMTLSMFPPETLAAIEAAAKKCADTGAFDPSMMSSLLAGMMGPGGGLPRGPSGGAPSAAPWLEASASWSMLGRQACAPGAGRLEPLSLLASSRTSGDLVSGPRRP